MVEQEVEVYPEDLLPEWRRPSNRVLWEMAEACATEARRQRFAAMYSEEETDGNG